MKRFIFIACICFLSLQISFGQTTETEDFSDETTYRDCSALVSSGKTAKEKALLQKYYYILLGVVNDLSTYRAYFLANNKPIDIFPTAYYHTTVIEMNRIASLKFKHPIEKMQQMIAFYDAYKFNRKHWDLGHKGLVEQHWKNSFEKAERIDAKVPLCVSLGISLNSAIRAHVQSDLQRAIRYAYNTRLDRQLSIAAYNKMMKPEFDNTDSVFAHSMAATIEDIKAANDNWCWDWEFEAGQWAIKWNNRAAFINTTLTYLMKTENVFDFILSKDDVVPFRHQAWDNAMSNAVLKDPKGRILLAQPQLDHAALINIGRNICPPEPEPETDVSEELVAQAPVRNVNEADLVGGTTPEALGRVLLKAIKTNDLKLWKKCIHPVVEEPDRVAASFARVRENLEEEGVTDWNALVFSRVTFSLNGYALAGGKDNGIYQAGIHPNDARFKGENIRRAFKVEFTYRNKEFVGWFGDVPIMTVKHQKYFMLNPWGANMMRF